MSVRAFSEVARLPRTLRHGDNTGNPDKKCDGERFEEEVSGKVWDLMRVGCNMNELTCMVQLLGDVPCFTALPNTCILQPFW